MRRTLAAVAVFALLWTAWNAAQPGVTGIGLSKAFAAPGDSLQPSGAPPRPGATSQPAPPPPGALAPPRPGMPGMGLRGPGGMPPGMAPMAAATDTFAAERDSMMNEVLKHIAGHEQAPAESVFKNIKMMTGMPAGRLMRIMNFGYGRSLGVRCTHCHVLGHWDAEDKPQKQIARDMAAMLKVINTEQLPKIKNLRSDQPGVNCTTCHRGAIKPAQNM